MYRKLAASIFLLFASTPLARTETIEVFPSVSVTKRSYDAPINEQPFYGFKPKNEMMLTADKTFVEAVEKNTGREIGADQFEAMGWAAVKGSDYATAAKRFNQAWLLSPGRSAPVHGMAVVTSARFGDIDFAIELAAAASKLKNPLPALPGDQGGLLIRAGKPDQAIPYLEKAATAFPDWINPQLNLATARFETGDAREACKHLEKVEQMMKVRPRSVTIEAVYQPFAKSLIARRHDNRSVKIRLLRYTAGPAIPRDLHDGRRSTPARCRP